MKAYKIVEIVDGEIRTLFHGVNGTRIMPRGEWLRAHECQGQDGTSKTRYTTGWHVLPTYEDCVEYLTRFTKRLDLLKIVECEVEGVRPKEHSPSPVLLARWIKFA